MNPEGLLNKIITGDENALRQLFEQYSQRLYHVAYYYYKQRNRLRRLCWMYLRLFGRKGNL